MRSPARVSGLPRQRSKPWESRMARSSLFLPSTMYNQTLRPWNDLVLFSIFCLGCLECFGFDTSPNSTTQSQLPLRKLSPPKTIRPRLTPDYPRSPDFCYGESLLEESATMSIPQQP